MASIENINSPRAVEFAREYLKRQIALTPVEFRGKKPTSNAWQKHYINDPSHAVKFEEFNVGFILGKASDGLTDIDLDCDESILLAPAFLPKTSWVFGHKSARRSHYMYQCDGAKTTKFIAGEDEGMVIEIRSTGGMTVAPGSMHPSDEPILFSTPDWKTTSPAKVELKTLEQACGDLAAASLILRHGWKDGKRDEVAVALCGVMLRAGRSEESIDNFLGAIADATGDEEHKMRLKAERQAKRLADGEKVPGVPSLIKVLGKDITTRVLDWLGVKDINVVMGLNAEIAYIVVAGKARVIRDGGKWSKDDPEFLTVQDARSLMAGKGSVKLGKKTLTAFDHWLSSRERREYRELVFKPDGCDEHDYNLWNGWPVEADPRGEDGCRLFLEHVRENICSGNKDHYDYTINWLADAIQNPTQRPSVAFVMQGDEGNGKTMFAEYVLDMFGKYGTVSTNQDHLFGKHNSHLSHKLMVFADESCWAGNRHHESVLKNIISGDKLSLEPKGIGVYVIDNYIRLMMATNSKWAVPVGHSARRFFIIRLGDEVASREFFSELAQERKSGGGRCLLEYLRRWKISRDLRDIPKTQALLDNKILTMAEENPIASWWFQRLIEGSITRGNEGWEERVECDRLYRDYMNKSHGAIDRSTQVTFGMAIKRLIPGLARFQSSATIGSKSTDLPINKRKRRFYRMPTLKACREFFSQEILRADDYEWEDGEK